LGSHSRPLAFCLGPADLGHDGGRVLPRPGFLADACRLAEFPGCSFGAALLGAGRLEAAGCLGCVRYSEVALLSLGQPQVQRRVADVQPALGYWPEVRLELGLYY